MNSKGFIPIIIIVIIAVIGGVVFLSQNGNLGGVGQSREWVFTRSSGLVRSLTTNSGTLVSKDGHTATTSAVTLEVVGSSLFRGGVTATSTLNVTGDIYATSSIVFDGELKPDGATCSNNEILKKTGSNDWDCAADDTGSAAGGAWEDVDGTGNVAITPTTSSIGILVNAASSTVTQLVINNATTSTLVIGNTNPSGFNLGTGDLFVGGECDYFGKFNSSRIYFSNIYYSDI